MSKMLKDLQKKIKGHHLISALAAGLVIYMIYRLVSRNDGNEHKDSMGGMGHAATPAVSSEEIASAGNAGTAAAAAPAGQNEQYSPVEGGSSTQGLPPSCNARPVANPSDLLPKDQDGGFGAMPAGGQGGLAGVNLLSAGHHTGINTVGSSLRNANLQLRSEPPNPQQQVSPWMNTTIEPDLMRRPIEASGRGQ